MTETHNLDPGFEQWRDDEIKTTCAFFDWEIGSEQANNLRALLNMSRERYLPLLAEALEGMRAVEGLIKSNVLVRNTAGDEDRIGFIHQAGHLVTELKTFSDALQSIRTQLQTTPTKDR